MPFLLTHRTLERLCRQNSFALPQDKMTFFGLRGATPINPDDNAWRPEHQLQLGEVDYLRPRCTLGQWLPDQGKLVVFLGSTVPALAFVQKAMKKGGQGANQMIPGLYLDYAKGRHYLGTPRAYEAFRQNQPHPVVRTSDDLKFANVDKVTFEIQHDNIHAATSYNVLQGMLYSSAGCQVVAGFPKVLAKAESRQTGPWAVFRDNAYRLDQAEFPYFLLTGSDAERAGLAEPESLHPRLRFGSTGLLVKQVQEILRGKKYLKPKATEVYDYPTFEAVRKFQEKSMGKGEADGVVGRLTAQALGFDWQNQMA